MELLFFLLILSSLILLLALFRKNILGCWFVGKLFRWSPLWTRRRTPIEHRYERATKFLHSLLAPDHYSKAQDSAAFVRFTLWQATTKPQEQDWMTRILSSRASQNSLITIFALLNTLFLLASRVNVSLIPHCGGTSRCAMWHACRMIPHSSHLS